MSNLTTNTQEWKTEYQQRAEQTQARRRAKGMYRRPTQAQEAAFRKCIARDGRASLTAKECDLLATYPYFGETQRNEYAQMAAQRRFAAMLTAMVGSDEAYTWGRQDSAVGRYSPPAGNAEHDDYIRGWNDAWAATQPAVKLSR